LLRFVRRFILIICRLCGKMIALLRSPDRK
jgi:hypothetical protein